MNLKKALQEKKNWHAGRRRVKALPKEYRFVYEEAQKYLFKVCWTEGIVCLSSWLFLSKERPQEKMCLPLQGVMWPHFVTVCCQRIEQRRSNKQKHPRQTTDVFLTSFYISAMTSTSTKTSLGSSFTATQERAGFWVKYLP